MAVAYPRQKDYLAADGRLSRLLGIGEGFDECNVVDWNDHPDQTKENVIDAMKKADV